MTFVLWKDFVTLVWVEGDRVWAWHKCSEKSGCYCCSRCCSLCRDQARLWPGDLKDGFVPDKAGAPLAPGRVAGAQGCPGMVGPGQALSRVCSSLIAAQVRWLVELGAASGQATRPG